MFILLTPSLERRKRRERVTLDHEIYDAEKLLAHANAQLAYLRKRRAALEPSDTAAIGAYPFGRAPDTAGAA